MIDSTIPTLDDPQLQARLQQAARRLASEFAGIYGLETVKQYIRESAERLVPSARIVDFLPLLTYRFARERLHALAQAEGAIVKDVPEVLFVCVQTRAVRRWPPHFCTITLKAGWVCVPRGRPQPTRFTATWLPRWPRSVWMSVNSSLSR
jgi:hypothetical protein